MDLFKFQNINVKEVSYCKYIPLFILVALCSFEIFCPLCDCKTIEDTTHIKI